MENATQEIAQTTEVSQQVETSQEQTQTVEQPQEVATTQDTQVQDAMPATIEPFTLPTEQSKNPYEGLTPDKVAEIFKGKEQDLLKQLGLSEFTLRAHEWEKAGSLDKYLEAMSVNWGKLSDDKTIESKLREQYSKYNLPEDKLQRMIQKEMRTKYLVDADADSESEEAELARIQMQIDAADYRTQKLSEQQQLRPQAKAQEPITVQPTREQIIRARLEGYQNDPAIKSLMSEKTIKVGDYNMEVANPNDVIGILADDQRYAYAVAQKNDKGEVITDANGNMVPNTQLLTQVALLVSNPQKFYESIVNHAKKLGEKKALDEAENVPNNKTQGTATQQEGEWEQWRKTMRVTY